MSARTLGVALIGATALAGCSPRFAWRMPSPDHRQVVEARTRGARTCVRAADRLLGCYDAVSLPGLVQSDDGAHVAFPARVGLGWAVARDGRLGSPWKEVAALTWSADGRHLAYAARDASGWRLVHDEAVGEPFDSLVEGSIAFAPQGSRLAYAAWRGGGAQVVLDDVGGPLGETVGPMTWSADGHRFVYALRRGGRAGVVGVDSATHDDIESIALSTDGRHLGYVTRDGDRRYVIEDGVAAGPYRSVRSLRYAPGGGPLCYARDDSAVVRGGASGPVFDSVQDPVFAATGGAWGYLAHDRDGDLLVLDGKVARREPRATTLALSLDGKRYAYIAERHGTPFVVDERGARAFPLLVEGTLFFCRNHRWACLAGDPRRRKLFVVVEGSDRRTPLDWTQIARLARHSFAVHASDRPLPEYARSWIRAEAELMSERQAAAP